jgi:hypothetical protein
MKRLGKVFWGVLCMILLFAFSHAFAENICAPGVKLGPVKSNETVKFEWNKSTTDEKDGKVIYEVYVYNQDEGEEPPNENVDNYKYGNQTEDTNYEIVLKSPGIYILGGKALLYKSKDGKPIGWPINKSTISWSCNKNCTNNNPQYVEVSE